ncbi:metallophosphoesterase [Halovenus salina]|uniref:Metallophosphoesterase n=1 Tax=Halovenus salina TaxID=1510225 RepID=A0ABD5VVB7_9EURY|nr:metallophosphoesterase [Halovenus salina]
MDALSAVTVRDRAVYLDGVLVVADLHVGRGSASNVELPVGDGTEMVERLADLCRAIDPETVVFAGDLLHSFRTVPRQVEATVEGLCEAAEEVGADALVTPGNHDTMLDAVWSGKTASEYRIAEETVVCHGHVEPSAEAERYIIGHDHPTITIEGTRKPCILAGDDVYRGADLLMLPSFNRLVSGVEINEMSATDFMSPLVRDVDALAPVVHDTTAEETLTFPTLGEFRHRL